jgi:TRAP-type C4-dicarboxylate transport system permease small subunit
MKEKLLQWLNLALMADLFFVLLCFFWFAAAVIGRAANVPLGLDIWYRFWDPVVQPALGILMAGAIISGIVSWVNKRLSDRNA